MIVTLDDPLPRPVLEEMRAIPGLSHAHYVDLGAPPPRIAYSIVPIRLHRRRR
jgi:hypothetical protein